MSSSVSVCASQSWSVCCSRSLRRKPPLRGERVDFLFRLFKELQIKGWATQVRCCCFIRRLSGLEGVSSPPSHVRIHRCQLCLIDGDRVSRLTSEYPTTTKLGAVITSAAVRSGLACSPRPHKGGQLWFRRRSNEQRDECLVASAASVSEYYGLSADDSCADSPGHEQTTAGGFKPVSDVKHKRRAL